MAEQETTESEEDKKSGSMGALVLWLVIVVLAIGGGVATPFVVQQLMAAPDTDEPAETVPEIDPEEESEFIEFPEEVTINLDEARFSRYLLIKFALQVPKSQKDDVDEMVTAKKVVVVNWLQTHVAEKKMSDLQGKFGRNRLRREMHDFLNNLLFDDGIERIQDVFFIKFNVQ